MMPAPGEFLVIRRDTYDSIRACGGDVTHGAAHRCATYQMAEDWVKQASRNYPVGEDEFIILHRGARVTAGQRRHLSERILDLCRAHQGETNLADEIIEYEMRRALVEWEGQHLAEGYRQ